MHVLTKNAYLLWQALKDLAISLNFILKKFDAIRLYLLNEAKRVGLTGTKLKEITGVGMWSHWFTKAEWALMPQHYYQELSDYYAEENGFEREYSDIDREYEQIKEEFNDTRPYFDNTHDNMNNVWHFDRVMGKDREETGVMQRLSQLNFAHALLSQAAEKANRFLMSLAEVVLH